MKILITGAAGIIGDVLMKCLSKKFEVIGIDQKRKQGIITLDILKNEKKIRSLINSGDIIIHLAWDTREAGTALRPALKENKQMAEIMFALAAEKHAKRFILASSVHTSFGFFGYQRPNIVKKHADLHPKRKIKITDGFCPLGTYGASKVYLETLGQAYATQGLQMIVVRFGNVTHDDSHGEYPFWLSHRDCCQFIEKCITTRNLPPFSTFFAVSNNACNPFDLSESKEQLAFKPQDGSLCPKEKSL